MKSTTLLTLSLPLLVSTTLADKTCTPSFDYCADELINSKGFTEADLKAALKGSDYESEDVNKILFHCTNPGVVGHPVLCASGCQGSATEGSRKC
ncbi:hypothetical protein BJX61DRAFT_541405 [Aspergillus egyptiacus]|nr:hypothetical protein BJX61DRAFT_541405 [Aspergillus egyptiacus]